MDHLDIQTGNHRRRPLFASVSIASAVAGLQSEATIQRLSVESFLCGYAR
jgi:hypothetical protein